MAILEAVLAAGRWRVTIREGSATGDGARECAARDGRAEAWRLAGALNADAPWEVEYLKVCLGEAESILGYAFALVSACGRVNGPDAGRVTLEVPDESAAAIVRAAAAGHDGAFHRSKLRSILEGLRFVLASLVALAAVAVYVARSVTWRRAGMAHHGGDGELESEAFALHGEWSTRTRHLLAALRGEPRVSYVILLGRLRESPSAITANWTERGILHPPRCVNPVSVRAFLSALPDIFSLLASGLGGASHHRVLPVFREQVAIAFRVLLGAVQKRWWIAEGPKLKVVYFGHTGTADTLMLEATLQRSGARTVHVVHGLVTGPNFVGFSDLAIFRCGRDAGQYGALGQYGKCEVQIAEMPSPQGNPVGGWLLLTNLAHPMNSGYLAHGLQDELGVLRAVAAMAAAHGHEKRAKHWKPHPVISMLGSEQSSRLRKEAADLGFQEIGSDLVAEVARSSCCVVTTPSTVAIDLMTQGILAMVFDPQGTCLDAAVGLFPRFDHLTLRENVVQPLDEQRNAARFEAAWHAVRPARTLNLDLLRHTLA